MKEVKFRAWHKFNGLMYSVSGLSYNAPDGSFSHICIGSTIFAKNSLPLQCFPLHDVELMQFTGVLDKNGKEIYEGDIVVVDTLIDAVQTSRIEFQRGSFIFSPFVPGKYCTIYDYADTDNVVIFVEIIGNIWENPGLLQEQKQ